MKLKIKQTILMKHLDYVIKGISTKNIIPILNCIKFELTTEGLYLMSTDNEIAIKTFISKKEIDQIDTCGEIVIAGKYIYEIIKKLPDKVINIEEVVDNKVKVYTDNSSFNLNCNSINDFPNLELEEQKEPILIDKVVFKTIISQTAFATSTQESRPVLTGINFKIAADMMECIATDSYRLALKKIKLATKVKDTYNIVVPTKNLLEVSRLLDDDGQLEIHIFTNKIIFKFDSLVIRSRLINGTYPNTSALIPDQFALEMTVDLKDFYNAIDRASLLTNEADKNTIKLESNKKVVTISSNIPEIGNVEELVNVEKNNTEEIKISFSSSYMLEALQSLKCEHIFLLFNGEIKPIIIKNTESNDLIQLILPIRTY